MRSRLVNAKQTCAKAVCAQTELSAILSAELWSRQHEFAAKCVHVASGDLVVGLGPAAESGGVRQKGRRQIGAQCNATAQISETHLPLLRETPSTADRPRLRLHSVVVLASRCGTLAPSHQSFRRRPLLGGSGGSKSQGSGCSDQAAASAAWTPALRSRQSSRPHPRPQGPPDPRLQV